MNNITMELLYSVRRKPLKCEPPQLESIWDPEVTQPIVTVSSGNIIAFSTHTELHDLRGDTWGGHVYVCDLDTPWSSHKVTSTTHPISALEWDLEGQQLLVGTAGGEVSVFVMKDYLLNDWTCSYTTSLPGEHIVKAIFFHSGRRVSMLEKKPDAPITERVQILSPSPTLRGFGGIGEEGAFVVTATGLACAVLPPSPVAEPPSTSARTLTECLRPTRDRLAAASIAHKNGNLLVSVVPHGARCVRSVLVSVRRASLHVQPLPSLYVKTPHPAPSISWCVRDDTDYLLVSGHSLSLWKLTERSYPVHKFFAKGAVQGNTTPGGGPKVGPDCFNTVSWLECGSWHDGNGESRSSLCSARGAGAVCAAVARGASIHVMCRDTLVQMCTVNIMAHMPPAEDAEGAASPPKKIKYSASPPGGTETSSVTCVDMSHLAGLLVAIDSQCQLYVYKLPQPWNDIPTPLSIQLAANLLEYAVVSGQDCLDVLMTVKPAALDALYERVTESFLRQPQTFQQYYYQGWLSLRAALCRLSASGQSAASSLTCLQMLHSMWTALEAALRPADSSPADTLAALLDDHHHALDIDKALLSIDVKEFACDTATLQALRRAVQRTCDTALAVIASVPHSAAQHHAHVFELCTDPTSLNLMRKIILLVRIWGLLRPQALPSFSRGADNLDAIYRPLTRLAGLKSHSPVPADVVEECASLAGQMSALRVWESLPRCCVCAPHGRQYPVHFVYGTTPESLKFSPEPPVPIDSAPALAMDSIRYMYLGPGCARWRECGRCGTRAMAAAHCARHPAQRAYDARFLPTCRCGGKWTLCSNI